MAKLTAAQFAEKWNRRLKSATTDIARGVDQVSESPGAKAAAARDKWVAKMTSAETHEKWARNVGSVSLEEWKQAMKEVGINRISGGADRAIPKVADFAAQLLAYQDSVLPKIHSMPAITTEDSRARMNAWFDAMTKFRYRRGG